MHPTNAALDIYLSMMEGMNMPWIVSCLAGVLLETPIARYALERGGHLRVGIEDAAGGSDMSNVEGVAAARELADKVGRPVVSAEAAKQLLKTTRKELWPRKVSLDAWVDRVADAGGVRVALTLMYPAAAR